MTPNRNVKPPMHDVRKSSRNMRASPRQEISPRSQSSVSVSSAHWTEVENGYRFSSSDLPMIREAPHRHGSGRSAVSGRSSASGATGLSKASSTTKYLIHVLEENLMLQKEQLAKKDLQIDSLMSWKASESRDLAVEWHRFAELQVMSKERQAPPPPTQIVVNNGLTANSGSHSAGGSAELANTNQLEAQAENCNELEVQAENSSELEAQAANANQLEVKSANQNESQAEAYSANQNESQAQNHNSPTVTNALTENEQNYNSMQVAEAEKPAEQSMDVVPSRSRRRFPVGELNGKALVFGCVRLLQVPLLALVVRQNFRLQRELKDRRTPNFWNKRTLAERGRLLKEAFF